MHDFGGIVLYGNRKSVVLVGASTSSGSSSSAAVAVSSSAPSFLYAVLEEVL